MEVSSRIKIRLFLQHDEKGEALGTFRKESECKHLLDIDPLSLEKL